MTDKPFDHEEYTRERLRQTTPGAGEGERWVVGEQDDDRMYPVYYMAEGDTYSELAVCWTRRTADLIVKLHNEREADQQTIANLETVVYAYKRAAENAEQTIAELRKALEEIAATDHEDMNAGYTAWVLSTEALAAIAATEEDKS